MNDTPPKNWTPKPSSAHSNHEWLGNRLRQLLKTYSEEPVPDRFKSLLNQLDDAGKTAAPQTSPLTDPTQPKKAE